MVGTYKSESIYKHQNKEKYLPPEPMEAFACASIRFGSFIPIFQMRLRCQSM